MGASEPCAAGKDGAQGRAPGLSLQSKAEELDVSPTEQARRWCESGHTGAVTSLAAAPPRTPVRASCAKATTLGLCAASSRAS